MKMNEEEAIERLNRFKTIKVMYGNTFAMHLEQLKQLQQCFFLRCYIQMLTPTILKSMVFITTWFLQTTRLAKWWEQKKV